ncbi:hypothetical protein STVIR_2560 [Streptomyces viridochromogenes Tue57]|uniref:Uncharacterized protein n=1 Tax=Streptomyces viridochromogenes Tue57 TaxID=1160705 RepID=L8PM23_STRVR|nr:hypothetical protein STVIR_2560 [Streptomyces viridochromogenes Tue57]
MTANTATHSVRKHHPAPRPASSSNRASAIPRKYGHRPALHSLRAV